MELEKEIVVVNHIQRSKSISSELLILIRIAIPISATTILGFLMTLVDLTMVGHLGKESLAAGALANTWFYLVYYPLLGVQTALDALFSQAYGAENYGLYGDWLLTGLSSAIFISIPGIFLLAYSSSFLIWFGQEPKLAEMAEEFTTYLIFGLIPLIWYNVLSKYLQAQHILMPLVWVGLLCNIINALLNYFLIYYFSFGLVGASIATSLSRVIQFILSFWYTYQLLHKQPIWPQITWTPFTLKRLIEFMKLGAFGGLMLAEEVWSFEVTTVLSGLLGTLALATHTVALNMCAFMFMAVPFPVAVAGSIRVGNLLGANDPDGARTAGRGAYILTFISCICNSILMFTLRNYIGLFFTTDEEVIEFVSEIIIFVLAFHIFDGLQVCGGSVFRAMGKHHFVAIANFIGFWVLGLGVGALLTFKFGWGLAGLWWGNASGLFCTTSILFLMFLRVDWKYEATTAHEHTISLGKKDINNYETL
eukprot:c95_g1_i1.p1 GENE.c95_g1_i1~~c95_g1_i1.p1  ORF type:complete len:478 (+),score=162.76 c95_g1_i1:37-1470(+)